MPSVILKQQIKEILEWRRTGILEGETLRSMARRIMEDSGGAFVMSEALSFAEKMVGEQCMRIVLDMEDTANDS